jgi:hypothetical protein
MKSGHPNGAKINPSVKVMVTVLAGIAQFERS